MEKKYFYGNEISDYGLECGRVDYRCFAKAFDAVLCNDIFNIDDPSLYDNMVNGYYEYYQDDDWNEISVEEFEELDEEVQECWNYVDGFYDVFQWYIVSDNARHLLDEAGEVYTYSEKLGVYIWGVTHYGTSWDYVTTSIKIDW